MSDQSSPPPKKVGSLRDRIAAFEKSASSAAPSGPAPAPRPKPAGFASWKPKPPSPPSSPPAGTTEHAGSSRAAGLSASDAKDSITKAGSLKERMAALQGKGGFGAPPPVAPKPTVERPKWKPPPVVHAPTDEEDHAGEGSTAAIAAAVEKTISPPTPVKSRESAEPHPEVEETAPPAGGDGDNEGEEAADPEEEERQRRAAIAARMARLGGARVGMAPPVFGRKPPARRPTQEEVPAAEEPKEQPKVEAASPEPIKSAETAASPPAAETVSPPAETLPVSEPETRQPFDDLLARKDSEGTSVLSSESPESQAAKNPSSMPIPAVPRRTGPPRKKPAKPATPPADVPEEVIEEKLDVPPAAIEAEPETVSDEATVDASKNRQATSPGLEHDVVKPEVHEETPRPSTPSPVEAEPVPEATPELTKHEEVSPFVTVGVSGPHPARPPPVSPPVHKPQSEISDLAEETSGIKPPPPSLATGVLGEGDDDDSDGDTGPASKASVAFPPHPTQLPIDLVDKELEEEIKDGTITPGDKQEEVDEEAEEEARRKRIAERLGNMGGVNPFAPPPTMQTKVSPGSEATSPPPPPSPPPVALPPRSPEPVQPSRKESIVIEEPKPEESDSDYDEEGFLDDKAKPPPAVSTSTQGQEERPQSTKVLAANQTGFTPQSPPPPIPSSTRPHVGARPDGREGVVDVENQPVDRSPEVSSAPEVSSSPDDRPKPSSRPAQQPRRLVPPAPEDDEELEGEGADQTDEEADERSHLFIPPPTDRALSAVHPRRANIQDEDDGAGDGSENDAPALPVLHRRSMEAPPPTTTRRQVPQPLSDEEEEDENALDSDHDGKALPIPPPHPATVTTTTTAPKTAERKASGPPPRVVPPPPPAHAPPAETLSPSNLTPSLSVSGSEVLDEEEGDPIDPSFHSPSRQTSQTNLRAQAQAQAPVQTIVATVTQPPASPAPPVHSPPPAARSLPPARSPPLPSAPPARSPPPVHHSPPPVRSPPTAHSSPPATLPPPAPGAIAAAEPKEELEEDSEQLRRKTIAERMAKLGGIRFGAAPLPTPASRPPPPPARHEEQEQEQEHDKPTEEEETPAELTEEEEERARKERIAAKLGSMGGMRIGMMPMGMGGLPPQRSYVLREEPPSVSPTTTYAAPPTRAVPPARPPPPPAQPPQVPDTSDSEYGSAIASDDGVKVEAEESEIEEVNYEDAEPEEAPPPIPSRSTRPPAHRQESTEKPTSPPPRPPVPSGIPVRRSSVQTTRSTSTSETGPIHPQRKTSSSYVPPAQSDYVMVEEPEAQEAPPPPVRRLSRPPPTRSAPQVPQAPLPDPKDSISSQWELPSIPTSGFDFEGGGADLSLSWTDAGEPTSPSSSMHPSSPPPPQPPTKEPAQQQQRKASLVDRPMSADDLMALWGRVGVQVCEVATTLFERSKKALIGDGTYAGFVATVLAGVPNAAPISILVNRSSASSAPTPDAHSNTNEHTYGYLIYVQSGAAVQRRASEILPGDIVEIHDGKLKGHKGIQMYHQNVGGDGETLVGIVGEFEAKKSKIRVFHANQHVGQQTVESVSYRLEDLKSGAVKVYRVLEA